MDHHGSEKLDYLVAPAAEAVGECVPASLRMSQSASVALSVVVPAYNEALRLPATLDRITSFLDSCDYAWEVIVADDGSDDATGTIAARRSAGDERFAHLRLAHRGKAAAVRAGVAAAQGEVIVFTDADLSTPIEYVDQVRSLAAGGWDVVIGTREAAASRRIGEPAYRHLMGRLYNYLVQALLVPGISDTQCGFKGFRAEVARDLFDRARLYSNGVRPVRGPLVTGFDVELLYLARKRGYRIYELPIVWSHVGGSKVRPLSDAALMLSDVLRVRLNDLRGRYPR